MLEKDEAFEVGSFRLRRATLDAWKKRWPQVLEGPKEFKPEPVERMKDREIQEIWDRKRKEINHLSEFIM